MAPPEGGIHVLDGSGIREGLANGNVVAKERFVQSDEGGKGHLTTAELRRAAEAEAAALLLGARIQSQILDRAFDSVVVDQGSEQQVDEQAFASVLENYLLAIADSLDGEKIFSFSLLCFFFFLGGNLVVVVCATDRFSSLRCYCDDVLRCFACWKIQSLSEFLVFFLSIFPNGFPLCSSVDVVSR
jgi:hypothetical protein